MAAMATVSYQTKLDQPSLGQRKRARFLYQIYQLVSSSMSSIVAN
jgi:hypothetical protein